MSIAMPVLGDQVEESSASPEQPQAVGSGANGSGTASPPSTSTSSTQAGFRTGINSNGRLSIDNLPAVDRNFALAIHLSPFGALLLGPAWFLGLCAPLVLWLIRKDQSTFVDDHGREMVNFLISLVVLHIILLVTVIGVLAWPVLWVVGVVSMVRGANAASHGEYFRYPMTFRFLN